MSRRKQSSRAGLDRSSGFGLVFVPNEHGDPRKLTRGFITQALHQAANEAAAQADDTSREAAGGDDAHA